MASPSIVMPAIVAGRLARVRDAMARRKLNGYLIQNRRDQYWLSGFSGEDGLVLVTRSAVVLLTDGRFDETADREAPWARKLLRKTRGPDVTAKELKRRRLERVGFDPAHMNVADYSALRKLAKPTRLVSAAGIILQMRACKDAHEIAAIREAIRVAQKAFERIERWIRPGLTERQVAAQLVHQMQTLGASGPSFAPIVASGPNASLPHYEPGARVITTKDPILIDWGARVDWYVSDLTRIIRLGSIPRRLKEIYKVVRAAHDRAIDAVRAGARCAAVDHTARKVIRDAGYGEQFCHALGHGIGLEVHEPPRLGKAAKGRLESGMVVTIEPGIYLPGQGGIRIESDVLVTDEGCEVLSSHPY